MDELRKFQSSTFDTLARQKHRGPEHYYGIIWKLQELQNEVNCMHDSKDFQDAESIRSGNSPRYQSTSVFPSTSDTWRDVEAFIRIAAPQRRTARHLGYTWYIGKRFWKSICIFISSLSSRFESMVYNHWGAASYVYSGEEWKTRKKTRSEMPVWTVSQRFSHLQWKRLFTELWCRPTTADFGSPLWQVPYTSNLRLLEDKVQDQSMYLFSISYGNFAMDERSGEMVDSVDELRSSSSTRGISMPNFEVLDARIASALNKIIQNSQFKRRISLEEQKAQKQESFLRGRQIAYLIYDYFRVTGSHDSVETTQTCLLLFFEKTIFRNSIRSGMVFTNNDENPAWWHLGKIVQIENTRVWETQDRESLTSSRPYWNCMTWRLIRRI